MWLPRSLETRSAILNFPNSTFWYYKPNFSDSHFHKTRYNNFEEEEEVHSIQYNIKGKYNTLIPPRKAPWLGIQGGIQKIQYKQQPKKKENNSQITHKMKKRRNRRPGSQSAEKTTIHLERNSGDINSSEGKKYYSIWFFTKWSLSPFKNPKQVVSLYWRW